VGTQLPARKTRTKKPNSGHEDSVANHWQSLTTPLI